jgi:ribonuclease E
MFNRMTSPLRPGSNRIIAAPGNARYLGRRSFDGSRPMRHHFRPSAPARVDEHPVDSASNTPLVTPAPQAASMPPAPPESIEFMAQTAAPLDSTVVNADQSLQINTTPAQEPAAQVQLEEEDVETSRSVKRHGPPRLMLINVTESDEVRIAMLAQGLLEELYVERASTELHVGNIYKGRVVNVEPAIQAAFVDFGIGKNGFLHISDVHPQYFPANYRAHRLTTQSEKKAADAGGEVSDHTPEAETPVLGDAPEGVYGDFEVAEEGLAEQGTLEIENEHIAPMEKVGRKTPRHSRPPIQQCLRRGQEIIVQVTKEGIGTKGPSLTSYISVPGRYLVMMPGMSQLGVSRKIENDEQRRELRKLMQELNPPKSLGFIVRTAGIDRTRKELQQDLHYLVRIWKHISQRIDTLPSPAELYQESDLIIRTIRDLSLGDIEQIVVDDPAVAVRIRDFLSIFNPKSAEAVQVYTDPMPLFQRYGVEREIEKINSHRVEMSNGGSLVIDSTEALVAVDVNSGRYREQRNAEMTAFNINKDAIKEICRQLRLRDLGGVIVIDFIDMRDERHKREIERLLRDNLKNDRAKTKVLRMSLFCMIEMTRQRVKPSLKRSIYQDCPHCHGAGLIKTPESVSLDVMRRLTAGTLHNAVSRIDVRVHPTVAEYLLNRKRKQLVELEERSGRRIGVLPDAILAGDTVLIEAFDVRGSLMNVSL